MNIYTDLLAICRSLEDESLEYALCGGLALAVHGFPRFTRDIDLLVREQDIPGILAVAAGHGYEFPAHPMIFQPGTPREIHIQRVSKVVGDKYLELDLIIASAILDCAWSTRMRYEYEGCSIQVVSKAGLIAMKRLADRDQDRLDIKTLEAADA